MASTMLTVGLGIACLLFLGTRLAVASQPYPPNLPCPEEDDTCYFTLIIEHRLVMMDGGNLVKACDGALCYANDSTTLVPNPQRVVQADGYHLNQRMVIVANGKMPGPTLDFYEHQTLVITVENHLLSEGVTLHWHGVVQKSSPLMDGVNMVSQCPILPGQTFTYTFTVGTPGTAFYHAHIGAQRTMGLAGPMISRSHSYNTHPSADPVVDYEYSMTAREWNHNFDSVAAALKATTGVYDSGSEKKLEHTRTPDGFSFSPFVWHAGLINGKGRHWDPDTKQPLKAPLEVYTIRTGAVARFRVMAIGTIYPLRVSVNGHMLTMIASDLSRFEDRDVQSFVVSPGERMDFLIKGDQKPGCYKIYAEAEIHTKEGKLFEPRHRAEAVLQYEENPMMTTDFDTDVCFDAPGKTDWECTEEHPCEVLNCHFEGYKRSDGTTCVHLMDLTSIDHPLVDPNMDYEPDRFYNFAFPKKGDGGGTRVAGAINGRGWMEPPFAAGPSRHLLERDYCTAGACNSAENKCRCTHYETLDYGKQYQFIFASIGNGIDPAHPIHLHGHEFLVVHQGFSAIDPKTGHSTGFNDDLKCRGEEGVNQRDANCNYVEWASDEVRDRILDPRNLNPHPIKKDTLTVPIGGYAVIRFPADNPGFWFMHCHIELHNVFGMAMMFNEAEDHQDPTPSDFPVCHNYPNFFDPYPLYTKVYESLMPILPLL